MIDSTGRRAMRADGTVLDLFPVGKAIGIMGVLLIALFTVIKPEASNGLGLLGRLLFWLLHVGLGLAALWLAGRWLANGGRLPSGTLPAVLVTGCAAILIATPGYMILDAFYAPHIIDLDPDPPIAWPQRLLTEVVELAPWFMLAWLLINLPVLLPQPTPLVEMDDSVSHDSVSHDSDVRSLADLLPLAEDGNSVAAGAQQISQPTILQKKESDLKPAVIQPAQEKKQKFLLSLPGVVGTDVVAVSSDLHYLNVWTVAGRSTVLGSLRDVVADLDDIGMQVHRSHWVAHAHVRRIVGTASNASCIMSNELRIPISRRRWKTVREHYGRGVVHTEATEASPRDSFKDDHR